VRLRRLILRGLLWSLALAAVAGVLAVLLPTRQVMVRVMYTGLVTGAAAGLMIALSFLLNRPRARASGLLGLSVVVMEYALVLALIWLEPLLASRAEERLGLTMLFLGLVGVFTLGYLLFVRAPGSALAAMIGLVSAGAALFLFLLAIWLPGYPFDHEEWYVSAWATGAYGLIAFLCLLASDFSLKSVWRWIGAACAAGGAVVVVYLAWHDRGSNVPDALRDALCLLTTAGILAGFVNLLLQAQLKPAQRWVRLGTIGAGAITAVVIDVFIIGERWVDEDFMGRIIAAGGIVTGCGSLALVVLVALNRRGAIEPSTEALLEMTVICPICDLRQHVPVGASQCRRCGLRMEIRLEEPRCPQCDYLLYKLASDRCPECGAAVLSASGQSG
jgi:hypothetical protein